MADEATYPTIRKFAKPYIGRRLLDVTQHDQEDFDAKTGRGSFAELMFEGGYTWRFPVGEEGFTLSHPDGCDCAECQKEEGPEA